MHRGVGSQQQEWQRRPVYSHTPQPPPPLPPAPLPPPPPPPSDEEAPPLPFTSPLLSSYRSERPSPLIPEPNTSFQPQATARPLFEPTDSNSEYHHHHNYRYGDKPQAAAAGVGAVHTSSAYSPYRPPPSTYGNLESIDGNNQHYQDSDTSVSSWEGRGGCGHIRPLFESPSISQSYRSNHHDVDQSQYYYNPQNNQQHHDHYRHIVKPPLLPMDQCHGSGYQQYDQYPEYDDNNTTGGWRDRSPRSMESVGHPLEATQWSQEGHRYPANRFCDDDRYPPSAVSQPVINPHQSIQSGAMANVVPTDVVRKVVPAENIFDSPGRDDRPSHVVIILRGLPGSGKSHLAKLMKEKEASYSAPIPRILSIDTYFINEVEKLEKDPDTGRKVKRKVEEYEFDESSEQLYRLSLLKQFNKTLSDGFFNMIIVDDVNTKISNFDQHWSNAKMKGYEAFIVELKEDIDVCVSRNIHNRTKQEIDDLAKNWEQTPPHFLQMDVTSLLHPNSETSIYEVEMDMDDSDKEADEDKETNTKNVPYQPELVKSRWEQDHSEDALDKLDGFARKRRSRTDEEPEESLTLTEYLERKVMEFKEDGRQKKKRVRWADLESAKEEQRKKEIGFTIGSKWNEVSEDEVQKILNNDVEKDDTNNT